MRHFAYLWWAIAIFLLAGGAYLKAQTVTPAPRLGAAVCAYNSSPPTGTSGTFIFVQCDSTGKLKIQ